MDLVVYIVSLPFIMIFQPQTDKEGREYMVASGNE